jgi:hypothetical protein
MSMRFLIEAVVLSNATFLKGSWKRKDGGENGSWVAVRSTNSFTRIGARSTGLYRWENPKTQEFKYRLEKENLPEPWRRSAVPLCEVWEVGAAAPAEDRQPSSDAQIAP